MDATSTRRRRIALAGFGLVLVAILVVVLVVSDPFAGSSKPSGVTDNATPTSLVAVKRQALSSQMQVSATLGYAGASNIRIPAGTAPSAAQQAQQAVSASEQMLANARASLSDDTETLVGAQARLSAVREQQAVDCAGDNAAESVSSSPSGEAASAGSGAASDGSSNVCASDVQVVSSDAQEVSGDAIKLSSDRAALASAQTARAGAEMAAATARSSAADYGEGATFTKLAAVGQVITRGESLFALSGQPTLLLYGNVVPSRAFLAGMSAGSDVAALNANLDALGYGSGLSGETFSSATEDAIRALQAARGMTVTGALPLGSVVFERGAVRVTRVTRVTPELGASVAPGPVLGVTSTVRQVTIALSAAEQSSVNVGDPVSITLPNNQTTPGVVSSVGTVAKAPSNKAGGGGGGEPGEEGGPTVEVDVTPSEPNATGHLDEAPVTVSITTASVPNALVVPIDALLALAGGNGSYALELSEGGVHHLEAVTLGLFDDAEGLVQVSGQSVSAGQRVVVPAA